MIRILVAMCVSLFLLSYALFEGSLQCSTISSTFILSMCTLLASLATLHVRIPCGTPLAEVAAVCLFDL
ncbi:hypothetical protein DFH11DRAFT_1582887, partial [Phellopilus nigrolimitatus]